MFLIFFKEMEPLKLKLRLVFFEVHRKVKAKIQDQEVGIPTIRDFLARVNKMFIDDAEDKRTKIEEH